MTDYTTYLGFQYLEKLNTATSLSFDCETTGLRPEVGGLRLLQFGSAARKIVVVVDLFAASEEELAQLDLFFANGNRFWTAHNAVFDLGWLQAYGWHPRGEVRCTMLASKLLNNGMPNLKHGLAAVAKRYLDIDVDKEQQRSDWSAELTEAQIRYAAKDVEILCELDAPMHQQLAQAGLSGAYSLECRALQGMASMSNNGLPFSRDALQGIEVDYEKDIENLGREFHLELDEALPREAKLPRNEDGTFNLRARESGSIRLGTKQYAGFNIGSPKQLLEKMTLVLGETPIDAKTQKPSASRTALREYAGNHSVVATYLQWKKAEKRRQMVASLLKHQSPDGFVRSSYWQLGAETGRMTCSDPNLQQVPRDAQFRESVIAPEGWSFIGADFSQMELRLLAVVAEDENMCTAFIEGQDLHSVTSEALGCERQISKSANFGLAYGSGAKGLRNYAAGMGVQITLQEATSVREQWLDTYYGVRAWHRRLAKESDKTAGQMTSIRVPVTGLRRFLPGDMNRLTVRANTPIQGAGAAILKCAIGSLWKHLQGSEEAKLCAAIHDELLLLVRKGQEEKWMEVLRVAMESAEAKWLGEVPAVADVKTGDSWAACH
jgi:DNA polymerase I-like protein with 3'-5' exonuclease and polymerase domains